MEALPRRPLVAVLDACVLFPLYLRDLLLSTAFHGHLYAPRWDGEILNEFTRNLVGEHRMSQGQATHLVARMADSFPYPENSAHGRLIPCLSNHPKDRHVVETALVCQAQFIVTLNHRDFREVDLAPLGLTSLPPDDFLLEVFEEHESVLPAVLRQQLGHYRQHPITPDELVAILNRSVPETMRLLPAQW